LLALGALLGGPLAALLAVPALPTSAAPLAALASAADAGASVHLTAAGDYGTSSDTTAVLDGIGAAAPDLHLGLGDYSYGGPGSESSWCSYVKSHVGATLPFELVAGNHESNGLDGQIENFASCLPNRLPGLVGTYGRQWYVDVPADAPVMRIVMISPNLRFPDGVWSYAAGTAHYSWTAAAIDGARAAGIPWVVVGFHEPCLSMTSGPCNPGPDLLNMLVAKKVDLVLMGHVHMYERTKQLALSASCPAITPGTSSAACIADADSTMTQGGTVFATIGSGGEEQQHPTLTDPVAPYFAAYNGVHSSSWGFLDATADSDHLTASFHTTGGSTLSDSFTISRTGAPPPPPPPPPPPDGDVGFVGADQTAGGSVRVEQVTVPATAGAGDTLVLFSSGSAGWSGPAGVTGWTPLGSTTSGGLTSSVWVKAASAADAGATVRVTNAVYTKGGLSVLAYRGVDTADVAAAYAADVDRASHTGPVVSAPDGGWVLSAWADKSGSTTSWTAPAGVTVRGSVSGTGGGHTSTLLADSGAPVPAGSYGPLTAVASSTSSAAIAWALALPAASGSSGGGGVVGDIGYLGTSHDTRGAVRTLSATVPASVRTGDALVLLFSGGSGWTGPAGVTGWRLVDSFTVGSITSSLWVKAAAAGDAGASVRQENSVYTKGVLQVVAYSGVQVGAITATRSGETNRAIHPGPAATVPDGAWAVSWWSEKSSTTTAWTSPAGVTPRDQAYGSGSGRYSELLADSGAPLPAGTYGPFTATADGTGSAAAAWTVVLPPAPAP
jgi:hypothetical protein